MLIVGCTTIPSRAKYLSRVLEQVEKQTVKPDLFCIGVPRYSTREKTNYDIAAIQEWAAKESGLKVVVSVLDQDYGPLCKLAGMLVIAPVGSTMITVDDDHVYDEKLIETLTNGQRDFPGCCICLCGHALGRMAPKIHAWGYRQTGFDESPFARALQLPHGSQVDIISGWAGVLYTRSMFGPGSGLALPGDLEFYRTTNTIRGLHQNDDLYISAWLSTNGIRRIVVRYEGEYEQKQVVEIGKINPLCHEGHKSWIKGHADHFVKWWRLINALESRGYFQETAPVPPNKSFLLVGTVLVATVLVVASIGANSLLRKK